MSRASQLLQHFGCPPTIPTARSLQRPSTSQRSVGARWSSSWAKRIGSGSLTASGADPSAPPNRLFLERFAGVTGVEKRTLAQALLHQFSHKRKEANKREVESLQLEDFSQGS